jgi:hypothetical protein
MAENQKSPRRRRVPDNIMVEADDRRLTIIYEKSFQHYLPFCMMVLLILGIFWWSGQASDYGVWLLVLSVLVGVGAIYCLGISILNNTIFSVDRSQILIQHKPIPWFGVKSISVAELDQFDCGERIIKDKRGNDTMYIYHLNAMMKNKKKIKLISTISRPDTFFFIEEEIENWLGIQDRRIA